MVCRLIACLLKSFNYVPAENSNHQVSFATFVASSVSVANSMARVNVSSSALILKSAFKTASLFTEQMKRVGRASSKNL